jgi:hypothetical protein
MDSTSSKEQSRMKTNQEMTIKIGEFGVLVIGHKTKMGSIAQIFAMGNEIRQQKGLSELSVDKFLRKESTWNYIAELNEIIEKHKSNSPVAGELKSYDFSSYKDPKGIVSYSKLIKKFPNVIKSKRGRYGGTFAHLELIMKSAMYLDPKLEAQVIHTFVTEKILDWRDIGGDEYLELNKLIDKLPNNKGKYDHIEISLAIRDKLKIFDTKGYNKKEHNAFIQKKRAEYLNALQKMIEVGFIKTVSELKSTLEKLR